MAPGTVGPAEWWLRPTEPDSGVTWSLVGGAGLPPGREARREVGVPGTTDVEQMSFAQEKEPRTLLEPQEPRPPTSLCPPTAKGPLWYRKIRSEGLG